MQATPSLLTCLPLPDYPFQKWTNILDGLRLSAGPWSPGLDLAKELICHCRLLSWFILVMIIQIGLNLLGCNTITYNQTSILTSIGITGKVPIFPVEFVISFTCR